MLTDARVESLPNGVVLARAIDGPGIDPASPVEAIGRAPETGGWAWLHLSFHADAVRRWLREGSGIPEEAVESMLADETRPRCRLWPTGVLFIARGVNLDPASTPEDMISMRAWLEERRLITVVLRRLRSAEDVASRIDAGEAFEGPGEVLVAMLERIGFRMAETVGDIGDALETLRERIIDEEVVVTTSELAALRLRAVTLSRYAVPLRSATHELGSAPQTGPLGESARDRVREVQNQLARITEDLAAIDARADVARDELASQASDRLNKRVYALTVLTAIFLPLSFLTGLLGINVGGMPGVESGAAFWVVCGLLVAVAALTLLLLHRRGWI